jgi:hypothetical protein
MPPLNTPDPSALAGLLALLLLAGFWPFLLIGHFVHNRYLRRLASERAGEDIGTFARGFDRRAEPFDPWVVRAIWDALDDYVSFPGGRVPLRPTDRLVEDLGIDPFDLDDLLEEVATRSGHALTHLEANPFFGKVFTVGDFVRSVTHQPMAAS